MKNIKFIITLILFISSFTLFAKDATLKGKLINNTKYTEIYLQDLNGNTIETQKINSDGSFKFDKKFKNFDFYILTLEEKKSVAFFPKPGEQAEVIIDVNDLKNPKYTNSKNTSLFYEYKKLLNNARTKKQATEIVKEMVDKYPNSPTCILFMDLISKDTDIDYHKKLVEGIKEYSNSQMVKDYIKSVENAGRLSIGSVAPEIELNSPEGTPIKLSSTRGNYVLIDFWASWCSPCRGENPNNVRLYKKYHDKGFEIYGVSLDQTKEAWVKAIKDDNLTWIHVSDLKGWQSEGAKIYNVRGIPHTVLLDKEGKIIATGLRGKTLEDKLKELFGE